MKIISILLMILMLASMPLLAQGDRGNIFLANSNFYLSDKEVNLYSQEAMGGSADAARKLANYYFLSRFDSGNMRRWALIGAENGDGESQYRAWQALRVSEDALEQKRAMFWLKKSVDQGYEGAKWDWERCRPGAPHSRLNTVVPCVGPGSDH